MPITKHNVIVTRAEDIARTMREAFIIANSGRPGPVLVDITKDAQQACTEFVWTASAPKLPPKRACAGIDQGELDRAIDLLHSAKRPLILAGHGIMISGAMKAFDRFVRAGDFYVSMTLLGIGCFPANDPLNLGMMGMHGEAWVNHAIQEADLLIAVGMRFDDGVTGDLRTYAKSERKIHIEIDRAEINKNVKVDAALVGDAREVLEKLIPHIQTRDHSAWIRHINELRGDSAVRDIQSLPDTGHLYAAHVINDLWKETRGEAIVVTDVGQHQMWEAQYYHHDRPRTLITSGGLGTMGFALPAAIGAKFAKPDSEVWAVVGDGGFQMTMSELATIVQEKINLKIAIINNGYLGMVRQWQAFFYDNRHVAPPLVRPEFCALPHALWIRRQRLTARAAAAPTIPTARDTT